MSMVCCSEGRLRSVLCEKYFSYLLVFSFLDESNAGKNEEENIEYFQGRGSGSEGSVATCKHGYKRLLLPTSIIFLLPALSTVCRSCFVIFRDCVLGVEFFAVQSRKCDEGCTKGILSTKYSA